MNEAVRIGIRILEILFFGGIVGSAILVLITSVEDLRTVLGDDDAENTADIGAQV